MPDSFRSPKVVQFEQQNEALLAQIAEMRERLNAFVELKDSGLAEPARVGLQTEFARDTLCNTPEQSLDSLKASIEEEAIERLIKKVINEIDWIAPSNFEMIASDLPRKYQPTEDK